MFPSSNSTDNPLESLYRKAIFCAQNPISKQDDHPIFSNFPSPFFDEHELPLNQMLSHNLQVGGSGFLIPHSHESHNPDPAGKDTARFNVVDASKSKEKSPETNPSPVRTPVKRRSVGVLPNNRAGKKDRHSKICTAQGLRDRRMRLSLQVARKFFDLQDLLGYDKASKTIEWLFSKSKKAIKELAKDHPHEVKNNSVSDAKSESFISECEVLSGIEENSNTEIKESKVTSRNVESPSSIRKRSGRKSQKTTSKSTLRESRDEARARARCRTREKTMMKRLGILSQWNKSNPNYADIQKVGSSNIPFEEPNSGYQERVSSCNGDYRNLPDVGTIENLLGSSCTSSISTDFQCPAAAAAGFSIRTEISGNVSGFLGNWNLLNNEKTSANQYSAVTNQVSLEGNPNSIFLASPNFPFHQ